MQDLYKETNVKGSTLKDNYIKNSNKETNGNGKPKKKTNDTSLIPSAILDDIEKNASNSSRHTVKRH
jgi:hypothetical protein